MPDPDIQPGELDRSWEVDPKRGFVVPSFLGISVSVNTNRVLVDWGNGPYLIMTLESWEETVANLPEQWAKVRHNYGLDE